jgi:hypothetical protein
VEHGERLGAFRITPYLGSQPIEQAIKSKGTATWNGDLFGGSGAFIAPPPGWCTSATYTPEVAADDQFVFGNPGDRFISHNLNRDGIDTPAIFRPSNTTHYFRFTNSQGPGNAQFIWGEPHWQPVAGTFTTIPTRP